MDPGVTGRSAAKVRLETPNYIVRTIERGDPGDRMRLWLTDPRKARMINMPPVALSAEDLDKYVASFDGRSSHLLGVFETLSRVLVGFWSVYVDWPRKEFLVNVLIGERGRQSATARIESQIALLNYFFDDLALDSLRCSVLADNTYVGRRLLRDCGAIHEHTSYKPSANGPGFVELHHYRGDRDAWHRLRSKLESRRRDAQPAAR
jgi:RimJ/RimL family protein N-acetyltransferase